MAADYSYAILYASIYISLLQGLILAIVQLRDNTYKFVLYREVKSWLGLLHNEKDSKLANIQGTSFEIMTAQLMVDLIYAILYSVTENTVGI